MPPPRLLNSAEFPQVEWLPPRALRPNPTNARTHSSKQIGQIAASIRKFGFLNPILVDDSNTILAGHGRWQAARGEGCARVPVLRFGHLTAAQKRAFVIADNKIAEQAGWDRELLAIELGELSELLPAEGLDVTLTGFEVPEIDALFNDFSASQPEPADTLPAPPANPTTRRGDLWRLGKHRLLCGDAQDRRNYVRLMNGAAAAAVFTDPPYNLRVAKIGGRGRVRHGEFAFASGEMSTEQYRAFLHETLGNGIEASLAGAVHFVCTDWRHVCDLIEVGNDLYESALNLVVWNKTNAGQGSFYRSQHELIGVFRVAGYPHQNNVELGRFDRNRSNVWTYAGVNSFGRDRLESLAAHPTVKPVAMVADALLDCTARGDIVLDQFAGSGTIFLAAEKVGRIGFGIEYEPAYVDVAVDRWQQWTKLEAILDGDGRTYEEVAKLRGHTSTERQNSTARPKTTRSSVSRASARRSKRELADGRHENRDG
jgi:DNA modification methylase